jgi:uracil-DNA glycosylase
VGCCRDSVLENGWELVTRISDLPLTIRNAGCRDCGLFATCKTVCLVGDGPVPCDAMVIGQAPGQVEDEVGLPFQGPSGTILDRELEEARLPRKETYVTNTVKCWPPHDRKPDDDERKACLKYLDAELEIVKPRYVLLVGVIPATLIGANGVGPNRGKLFDFNGAKAMVTYHPAAWGKERRAALHEDVQRFGGLVRGEALDPKD